MCEGKGKGTGPPPVDWAQLTCRPRGSRWRELLPILASPLPLPRSGLRVKSCPDRSLRVPSLSLLRVEVQLRIHSPPCWGSPLPAPGALGPQTVLGQPGTRSVLVAPVPDTASQVWDLPGGKTLPRAEGQGRSVCPEPRPHLDATWMHPWPPLQAPALEPLLASPSLGLFPKKRLLHRAGRRGVKTGRAPGVGPAELKPSRTFSDQRPGLSGWGPPHLVQMGPSGSLAESWDRDVSPPCVCWAAEPGRPRRGAGRGAGERGCPR